MRFGLIPGATVKTRTMSCGLGHVHIFEPLHKDHFEVMKLTKNGFMPRILNDFNGL